MGAALATHDIKYLMRAALATHDIKYLLKSALATHDIKYLMRKDGDTIDFFKHTLTPERLRHRRAAAGYLARYIRLAE
jgi:hypothetical protein